MRIADFSKEVEQNGRVDTSTMPALARVDPKKSINSPVW